MTRRPWMIRPPTTHPPRRVAPWLLVASRWLVASPWLCLGCDDAAADPVSTTAAAKAVAEPVASELVADAGRSAAPIELATEVPGDVPPLSCGGLLGTSSCDPVTAWPCDTAAGQTCELSNLAGGFRCYEVPTAVPFCGSCDRETLFCGPGTTCGDVFCERYCCADSDCERGPCLLGIFGDRGLSGLGFCPEDSAAVCGSTVGEQVRALRAAFQDAGAAEP